MKKLKYILIPIIILVGLTLGVFYYINDTIHVPTPKGFFSSKEERQKFEYEEEKGFINILLIGIDAREKGEAARTDSIILATLDTNNKTIKLTSFMRDMYVPIPGYRPHKINAAFTLGGPELLMKTLYEDFQVNVQYYICIDFNAFQDVIDTLGGVEVEVKDYEVAEINKYIKQVNGKNSTLLSGPGYQKLNGQQALSYCRIRKVGNGDYERTERQRKVLGLLIDKVRGVSVFKLPELAKAVLPYIKTNIPTTKLMNIGYTAYKFGNTPVEKARVPFDYTFEETYVNGMSVLIPDFQKNAIMLEKFLYSASGALSNTPIYMVNNYHSQDKPIDKRGKKPPVIKLEIPKEEIKNETDSQDVDDYIDNKKQDEINSSDKEKQNTTTEQDNQQDNQQDDQQDNQQDDQQDDQQGNADQGSQSNQGGNEQEGNQSENNQEIGQQNNGGQSTGEQNNGQ
ncbi:MAG: LytR family transcriptional regulator [Caloramator sp.]|jgi:LCP family protein required for cell wall assembly|uniref:LCP family protein n=1 Tax=Caloramator sp. TaxID=1871330 RepID=UPI001DAC9E89|nr:LCP family protein [Caloramator sp.]MBZ4664317.1 LytR family transcriptional regulator [Caloramator sp.]